MEIGEEVLTSYSGPPPTISVALRLTGPEERRRAEVTITNEDPHGLTGVEVYFQHPGDIDVELLDRAARIHRIAAESSHRVDLEIQPGPDAPADIPLRLIVEADRFRTLARWDLELPLSGDPVRARAPTIAIQSPLSANIGTHEVRVEVRDDGLLDHVVAYVHGRKVAWAPGGHNAVVLPVPVDVQAGSTPVVILTADDQGLVSRRAVRIRGIQPATVDADPN